MLPKTVKRALSLGGQVLALVAAGGRALAGAIVPVEPSLPPDVWRGVRNDFEAATAKDQLDAQISQVLNRYLEQGRLYSETIRLSYGLVSRSEWAKLDAFWLGRPELKADVELFRVFIESRAIGTGAFLSNQGDLLEAWVHKARSSDPYDGDGDNGHGNDPGGSDPSNPGGGGKGKKA